MLEKFLKSLNEALRKKGISETELIKEYYTELFFDQVEDGKREEEIIASFGSIEKIVNRIIEDETNGISQKEHIAKNKYEGNKNNYKSEEASSENKENILYRNANNSNQKNGNMFSRMWNSFWSGIKNLPQWAKIVLLCTSIIWVPVLFSFVVALFTVAVTVVVVAFVFLIIIPTIGLTLTASGIISIVVSMIEAESAWAMAFYSSFGGVVVCLGLIILLSGILLIKRIFKKTKRIEEKK